jgi:hypothetical protein
MNLQSTASSSMGSAGHAVQASEILARQLFARQKILPGLPLRAPALLEPTARVLPLQDRKSDASEARQDVPIEDISFCALHSEPDIRAISHLREELHLPGSALAEPEFRALEKKETSTGWWALSRAMTH